MKIPLLLFALFISTAGVAQRSHGAFYLQSSPEATEGSVRNVIDTIMPSGFVAISSGGLGCVTGFFSSSDTGYVTGNNGFGDLEKAQFYSLSQLGYPDTATIQSVLVRFAYKALNSFPEDLFVKIYDADGDTFQPANLIGMSNGVNLSAIAADGSYTQFIFSTAVTVPDSFFISVQLPSAAGDTAVIQTTADDCTEYSGWSWEKWSNQTWHSLLNSWILDVDLAIFPVADLPSLTGVQLVNLKGDFRLFPNPVHSSLYIVSPRLDAGSKVKIQISNSEGVTLQSGEATYGENGIQIDLNDYADGVYFITLQHSSALITGKAIVIH